MSKKRTLTPEEERLWRQAMRDIEPLHDSKPVNLDEDHASAKARKTAPSGRGIAKAGQNKAWEPTAPKKFNNAPPPVIRHTEPVRPQEKASGDLTNLNRQEKQRVRRGKVDVDGKIDLHGLRQNEAHQRLIARISDARLQGKRILLVVTGKGAGKEGRKDGSEPFWDRGGGILKQQVPIWLREEPLRSMIFSVQEAHQRHGGSGALYVFLKKVR